MWETPREARCVCRLLKTTGLAVSCQHPLPLTSPPSLAPSPQIPILADVTKDISARYGVLIEKAGIANRGLFIINPQGVVQQITINDLPIGRR